VSATESIRKSRNGGGSSAPESLVGYVMKRSLKKVLSVTCGTKRKNGGSHRQREHQRRRAGLD